MHYKKSKYKSHCLFHGANWVPQRSVQGSIAFESVYVDTIEEEEGEAVVVDEYYVDL